MSGLLLRASLTQAGAALSGLAELPLYGLSDAERLVAQEQAVVVMRQAEAVLVGLVDPAMCEGRGRAAKDVLVGQLRLSHRHAGDVVETAKALRDPQFQPTAAALAAGTISAEHAKRVTQAVNNLPSADVSSEVRQLAQEAMLEQAAQADPDLLVRVGKKILSIVDPDAADRIEEKRLAREEREAARERVLWFKDTHDGTVLLGGRLDAASARIVRTALEPLAKPTKGEVDGSETGEHGERRTYRQRLADALVELARRPMKAGELPKQGGHPTQLTLTMRWTDLRDELGTALLPTGETMSAARARVEACDAGIIPALLTSEGVPLDVGRMKRGFEGPLRKALDLRDGGCAFPGCDIHPTWCDGHHIIYWANGGVTSLTNGVLLCKHHHSTIHQGGWEVRMAADGRPEFLPPPWIDPERRPRRNHRPHAA